MKKVTGAQAEDARRIGLVFIGAAFIANLPTAYRVLIGALGICLIVGGYGLTAVAYREGEE